MPNISKHFASLLMQLLKVLGVSGIFTLSVLSCPPLYRSPELPAAAVTYKKAASVSVHLLLCGTEYVCYVLGSDSVSLNCKIHSRVIKKKKNILPVNTELT